ncbi:IS6 family transposase [Acetobacter sacchari]|uniref:IS6 family transposase n=1 Tax=Acetobacter sacchari TaxID=2661687 RepID=A0ABS3LWD1_9PROT|nr:IS6 family transposase [Acetobacter sacchari]
MSSKRHRFQREVITHAVWLYFRLPLSFRLIEEMLMDRGITVSYEAIRRWSQKFGSAFARLLRRTSARPGDICHLDEVRIVSQSQPHWLWRADHQDGYVLDEILQIRRNTKAARRLLTRLLKKQVAVPGAWSWTNYFPSYAAARRRLILSVRHLSHKGLNNRDENSHLPLRKRAVIIQIFRDAGSCQRFRLRFFRRP